MKYPFHPKSTAYMRAGHFWPIPLDRGGFGCGMVLDVDRKSRTMFLAALVDWSGPQEPDPIDLKGRPVLVQGEGHIKMIQKGYESITGDLPLDTAPSPLLWTGPLGWPHFGLYRGLELIETIGWEAAEKYPSRRTWGSNVIKILAEHHFPRRT